MKAAQPTRPNGRGVRILIVDDEPLAARDLEQTLTDMGYDVVAVVASGGDAIEKALQRNRRENDERYRFLFDEGIAGAFQVTLDGMLVDANQALAEILGYRSVEEVTGRPADRVFDAGDWNGVVSSLREEGTAVSREVRAGGPDDGAACLLVSCGVSWVSEHRQPVVVGTAIDITERKRLESDLEWMAYHDDLTGLLNRRALMEQAPRYVALAERRGDRLAVAYVDLSDFKAVNDRFGHDVGDAVLSEVASRLEEDARASDLVARIGGDEFVVFMTDVSSVEAAETAARRLAAHALGDPVECDGHSIAVDGDCGVAAFPRHGTSFEELLAAADAAMYELKKNGAGHVAVSRDRARRVSRRRRSSTA